MNLSSQFPKAAVVVAISLSPLWAQNQDNWNRFNQPATQAAPAPAEGPGPQTDPVYQQQGQAQNQTQGPQQVDQQQGPPPGAYSQQQPGGYNQPQGGFPHFPQNNQQYGQSAPAPVAVPPTLTIPAGKYLTVRTTGVLTSDRNQPGDAFSATLAEPLVIDGFVVAQRGQTVNGRVVDVEKAGRVKGTSSMRVELTELNLVDGQQIPFKTQMVFRKGETSIGRDVAGVGTTTAVGAAIGAGVNGGVGAGVGAGAGLVVGLVGALVTRGRPTVIYPETALTFRVEAPIAISTARSANAFLTVSPRDYDRPVLQGRPGLRPYGYGYGPGVAYAYPAPYYGAFYGGPAFFYGGRFGYRRW